MELSLLRYLSSSWLSLETRIVRSSVLLIALHALSADASSDTIRLQLRWHHQFQFAGYYIALEKGFYREAGLKVELLEGGTYYKKNYTDALINGEIDFYTHNSTAVIERSRGKPIVALAAVTQTSPFALIALASSGIATPADLAGKRLPDVKPRELYAELFSMLRDEGIDSRNIAFLSTVDPMKDLIDGKLDAIDGYVTNETFLLRERGIGFTLIAPYKYGTNFYNDVLITSEQFLRDNPAKTDAFVRASLKGWEYALAHVDETIELVHRRYASNKSIEHLRFEAKELHRLINPEFVRVGHMNPERWRHIGETYAKLGIMDSDVAWSQFLYDPVRPPKDLTALYRIIVVVLVLLTVASVIAIYVVRLNRQLEKTLAERMRIHRDLQSAKVVAESANLVKTRFLAAASHDLRQPIQAIGLFVDALGRTQLSEEQTRLTKYLAESTQTLGDLLNALLDISKLDAGVIKPDHETIPVDTLISKVESEFSALAAKKSLRFKLIFPFRDMILFADPKLLVSLLGNLIGNAIKYTERGGLLVAIRRRGTQALIQVWDTGCGIAPQHLESIFEEYFQIENPERDNNKGLGLGLAIARRIARMLETEVQCRSRYGKGSVFEFRVPLATAGENAPTNQVAPPTTTAKPSGRRIVLVEDDQMVGTATKLALESFGMTVTRYKTAEEALADPAIAIADFYISDLRLPGLSGIEFLDAVQRGATKPIQAVVVTGDTLIDQVELMRSTSWRVLFKPLQLSSLLSEIQSQDSVY